MHGGPEVDRVCGCGGSRGKGPGEEEEEEDDDDEEDEEEEEDCVLTSHSGSITVPKDNVR